MHSIPFLTIALTVMSSNVKANDTPGNLAFCVSDHTGSGIGEERCLDPLDGVLKPFPPAKDGSIQETASQVLNWRYDDGLIRASIQGQGPTGEDGLCLGPIAKELKTVSSKPYELALRDCPSEKVEHDFLSEQLDASTETRRMRFLVTEEGRVQSLAVVIDPATGEDTTSTNPYCLTASDDEKAYLAPCAEQEHQGVHQVFDVHGTYSGFFLMPLRSVWAYDDTVEIAYQVGAGSAGSAEAAYVEITVRSPIDGMSLPSVQEWVVGTYPLETSAGILSFAPSDYRLEGPMAASIKLVDGEINDGLVPSSRASFLVSKAMVPVGKGPHGSYVIFTVLLLCFVGCFVLSSVADHLCLSRTRAEGDGSNDGKTVCMSTEEEDDFPLEDIDEDIEEGNRSNIHKENDTDEESDTDLDESRNSSTGVGSAIACERDEVVLPEADGDDNDERSDGNNETNNISSV